MNFGSQHMYLDTRSVCLDGCPKHVTVSDGNEEHVTTYSPPLSHRADPPSVALFNAEPLDYSTLAVKNTFLHFEDDSDSDSDGGALLVRKTKSAPMKHSTNLHSIQQSHVLPPPPIATFTSCFDGGSAVQANPISETSQMQNDDGLESFPSIGSVHHASGTCRPCAWFWKRQGCRNGTECRHCHLCPESELKQRKKEKIQTLRHQERVTHSMSV